MVRREGETRCGLLIVNLQTGDAPHWLRFVGPGFSIREELIKIGAKVVQHVGYVAFQMARWRSQGIWLPRF